jgi:transcriptional regulator with PAS, ATPase and Fis domain
MAYDWPGNVRELENILGRAVINMKRGETAVRLEHLPALGRREDQPAAPGLQEGWAVIPEGRSLGQLRDQWEKQILLAALAGSSGNRTAAARKLGISLRTLYNKLERHGLIE